MGWGYNGATSEAQLIYCWDLYEIEEFDGDGWRENPDIFDNWLKESKTVNWIDISVSADPYMEWTDHKVIRVWINPYRDSGEQEHGSLSLSGNLLYVESDLNLCSARLPGYHCVRRVIDFKKEFPSVEELGKTICKKFTEHYLSAYEGRKISLKKDQIPNGKWYLKTILNE